jgi:hypothetical protein
MRWAVINKETKKVVNVIEWEGAMNGNNWSPPKDHYIVPTDLDDIGDTHDPEKQIFIKKEQVPHPTRKP